MCYKLNEEIVPVENNYTTPNVINSHKRVDLDIKLNLQKKKYFSFKYWFSQISFICGFMLLKNLPINIHKTKLKYKMPWSQSDHHVSCKDIVCKLKFVNIQQRLLVCYCVPWLTNLYTVFHIISLEEKKMEIKSGTFLLIIMIIAVWKSKQSQTVAKPVN